MKATEVEVEGFDRDSGRCDAVLVHIISHYLLNAPPSFMLPEIRN